MTQPTRRVAAALAVALAALSTAGRPAEAKITRIEIAHTEPAFGGAAFGPAGAFERVIGRAYGEVDPAAPGNAVIQDIALAPRNARGMVEYSTDVEIVRPADPARSNHVLLFNILNRGNKGALSLFNADIAPGVTGPNKLESAGDGWLQREGYTLIWFGWQADVLPGDGRMTFQVPVAHNPDGSPVTGVVRAELVVQGAPADTLNLSSGWFTGMTHASAPTASRDNQAKAADGFLPTLTVRAMENAPRVVIPNTEWRFGACSGPNDTQICYPAGFQPGKLYELIYRAKDPLVMGLGFAVARDLGAYLGHADKDDAGAPNPVVHGAGVKTIVLGTSQSGRFIRSMIAEDFNRGEDGKQVFDGAFPHIGGGLMPLNLRFSQPGRAWGQQVDHLYPAYDFPFTYAKQTDPLTGRTQGLLDRCEATGTCPRLFHAATALEIWEGRQSLGLTDPLGLRDAPEPANARTFIMASTQHGPANLPLPTNPPFPACVQQSNPNPHTWTMRALLTDLTEWVRDDKAPPASIAPRIADGTLVAPDQVRFPLIPANNYGGVARPAMRYTGATSVLHVLDFGPRYRPGDSSGVITVEPPRAGTASYGVLVPQVDADGIDVAGVRDVYLGAPIGTYTGWNSFRPDLFQGGFCNFNGSFVPFAGTKAERDAAGDPRPSLEERYPTKDSYVAAVKNSGEKLVAIRMMLPADAARLVSEAQTDGVRKGP
jgi:hypothetical protein